MSTITVIVTRPTGTDTITPHNRVDAGNIAAYVMRRVPTVRIRRSRPRR